MLLKGTRKLLATVAGILGIVGLNVAMAIYAPGVLTVATQIVSLVGISGLAGYEVRTQGGIDRELDSVLVEYLGNSDVTIDGMSEGLDRGAALPGDGLTPS